jgi:DNA replication protein DnaC
MSTDPRPAPGWAADFAARHRISLSFAAEGLGAERAEKAAEYAEKNTPARFAGAVPTVPDVERWVADVVRHAVATSHQRGQQIVTIHGGPSLLMLGPTGVGKTHETYGAMRAISLLGIHAKWVVVSAADLYARLRPRHGVDSEAEFRGVADAPLLGVDDIGAAKPSEWVEEVNFRLVNRRYELALPTVFNSNLPPRDLPDGTKGLPTVLGDRVASRLIEMCQQTPLRGEDRRRKQ